MPGGLGSTHESADPRQRRRHAGARGLLVQRAGDMNRSALTGWACAIMIVSEAATLAQHRAVLVLEHADRLDRLHPVRRRHRLSRARRLVDSRPRRASSRCSRSRRFRCGSSSSSTTCSSTTGTTSACPRTPGSATFGYAWSFATIWPAIFEGAELIGVCSARMRAGRRAGPMGQPRAMPDPARPRAYRSYPPFVHRRAAPHAGVAVSRLAAVARYLAAPVWLGFIFLLDPINARLGGESLSVDLRARQYDRLINLALERIAVRRAVGVLELLGAARSGTTRCRSWST